MVIANNYIGQGGLVSYAVGVPNTQGIAYRGSIGLIDQLFEANQQLVLWLGPADDRSKYCLKVENGKIVVYEKNASGQMVASNKNIQQVLQEVFGPDVAPYYLYVVLAQLVNLAKSGNLNGALNISPYRFVRMLQEQFSNQIPTLIQLKSKVSEVITIEDISTQNQRITEDQARKEEIRTVVARISDLITRYNSSEISPEEKAQIAQEIKEKLETLNAEETRNVLEFDSVVECFGGAE